MLIASRRRRCLRGQTAIRPLLPAVTKKKVSGPHLSLRYPTFIPPEERIELDMYILP